MKVLYLGAFSEPTNTEHQIARALELAGCEVERMEESTATAESIVAAASAQEPDLFLFAKARFRGANQGWPEDAAPIAAMLTELRQHVSKIVCWQFDLMAKEFALSRYQWAERVAQACDLFVVTDGFTAPSIVNSLVIRQGAPDDVDQECPWDVEPKGDVLFLGSAYRDRQDLLSALSQRFGGGFAHVNNVRGHELTRLIRSYRICVGPHYPHFAQYWSNRLYVVTGHGGLFACPVVQGMDGDGWYAGQNYLALPNTPSGIADKLAEYLTKHDQRQLATIRRNGYEHATENCSYDRRVDALSHVLALAQWQADYESPAVTLTTGNEPTDEPTELEADESGAADETGVTRPAEEAAEEAPEVRLDQPRSAA